MRSRRDADPNMEFQPLSKNNIAEAIDLVHAVFPDEAGDKDSPARAYHASIEPEKDREFYGRHRLKKLQYFVVIEEGKKEIVGVTGFYTRAVGPSDMAWLGWYCVSPTARGKGVGRRILAWTVAKAKEEGFKTMRLYTSTDPNEAEAQKLYEKMGFHVIPTDDPYNDPEIEGPHDYGILYREKKL